MNNPFSSEWGLPGTNVMQGMSAAAQANAAYQQSMQQFLNTQQQRANVPVLEQQRQLLLGRQAADLELNKLEDQALLGIAKGNYTTKQDYLSTLNKVMPTSEGYSRVLETGPDGKSTILLRDPMGNIVGQEPAYTGKAAQDNLLLNAGRNMRARATALPGENQAEANLAAQLAINKNSTDNSLAKQMFELEMKMLGLGGKSGGRSGGGSGSSGGSASGGSGMLNMDGTNFKNVLTFAHQSAAQSMGLSFNANTGQYVDANGMAVSDPNVLQQLDAYTGQLLMYIDRQYQATGSVLSAFTGGKAWMNQNLNAREQQRQIQQDYAAGKVGPYPQPTAAPKPVALNVSGSQVSAPSVTSGAPIIRAERMGSQWIGVAADGSSRAITPEQARLVLENTPRSEKGFFEKNFPGWNFTTTDGTTTIRRAQ